MVVECPECGTSFQLPADRLSSKGSKLRCSKCSHTFRVRLDSKGQLEIFYKEKTVADPPTQDLSDLFDDPESFDSIFSNAGQVRVHPDDGENVDLRNTVVGRPTSARVFAESNRTAFGPPAGSDDGRSKSAAQSYNPFPFAGAVNTAAQPTTPAVELQESSINLFDDEDDASAPSAFTPFEDPFGDAFGPGTTNDPFQAEAPKPAPVAALRPSQPAMPIETTAHKPLGVTLPDVPEPRPAQGADLFGSVQDMVDPNFGEETPSFDPNLGRIVAPPAVIPPRPTGPPTGQRPAMAPVATTAPAKVQSAPVVGGFEIDTPPRIGGGGFQKFVNFLFLLVLAVAGFLGYIAFKMDGLLDFKNVDHMLGVAFEGVTYEPRQEWVPVAVPAEPVASGPVVSENVFSRIYSINRRDSALVVSGVLRNQTDTEVEITRARVILLDANQKVIEETTVSSGRIIPVSEIAGAKSTEEASGLSPDTAKPIAANSTQPIQAVFFGLPNHVIDSPDLTVRVEVISP